LGQQINDYLGYVVAFIILVMIIYIAYKARQWHGIGGEARRKDRASMRM
jgi:hypothetical protein